MKRFEAQAIELQIPAKRAFSYIADPTHLPHWTSAFASAGSASAVLRTPQGQVEIGLEVQASEERATVDWLMSFPDGSASSAFSRVVPLDAKSCVYSFVLTPPPVALEQLEGTLESQARTLAGELRNLKAILERHG